MTDEEEKAQLDKAWMASRIIWFVLFGTLGIYVIVAKFLEGNLTQMEAMPFGLFKNILFGVAIVLFITAHFVRRSLIGSPDSDATGTPSRTATQLGQTPAAGRYIVAIVASAALSESIGVCGLVLFVLSQDATTLYQFVGISAIAMFIYRPKREEFEEIVASAGRKG